MAKTHSLRAARAADAAPAKRPSARVGHGGVIDLHGYCAPHALRTAPMDGYLGYLVRRLDNRIYQSFIDALADEHITPARFTALEIIAANPGVRQTDIARVLGIARPAALKVVNLLVELGLIECHPIPSDKRIGAIALTARGQKKLAEFELKVLHHEARISAMLSDAERTHLMALLQRMLDGEPSPETR